jgi:hypothetical protein
MYSFGSGSGFLPSRGLGFVRPSSNNAERKKLSRLYRWARLNHVHPAPACDNLHLFIVTVTDPLLRVFRNIRVSSLKN